MNNQIRKISTIVLLTFALLGVGIINTQFIFAPLLNVDTRNQYTVLHAAETDYDPIIVGEAVVASSQREENSERHARTHSEGPLYMPVAGYFSSMGNTSAGIEAAKEDILDGQSQTLPGQRLHNLLTGQDRQDGGVSLTLDSQIQRAAAEVLGNRKSAVVTPDAHTGAVLAVCSSPTFDPSQLASSDASVISDAFLVLFSGPNNLLFNRTIPERYASGSAFKILTTIALIGNGLADPDMHMPSPASATLPGAAAEVSNVEPFICDDDELTLTEAFARSCNTTFILASEQLTNQQLFDMMNRFSFDRESQILLTITPSVFPASADAAQLAMNSINQYTVQTTPLQMAQIAQATASDGQTMTPYLIDSIVDADSRVVHTNNPIDAGKPISSETASKLRAMMESVVSQPYDTGTAMTLPNTVVAVKTGTVETGNGDRMNVWAIGSAPVDSPRVAFAVLAEDDDNDPTPHGGDMTGLIARILLEAGLR